MVKISNDLFYALCEHFLYENDDDITESIRREDMIKSMLAEKREAILRRHWYSLYKTAPAGSDEREQYRQKYLDAAEIPKDYRWNRTYEESQYSL